MGRAAGAVIFFVCFVIFLILKAVLTGAKAAYESFFDPNAKDEKVRQLVTECMLRVSNIMHKTYTGQPGELSSAILHLTPAIQSLIPERGYQVPANVVRALVCSAIVEGGHATQQEVERA